MDTILKEKTVFDHEFLIEEAEIKNDENKTFKKMRLNRKDAAAILLLNTESNKFILTSQFRYPIFSQEKENILEIVAGKIDEGEEPLDAIIRETEEEVGYRLTKDNVHFLFSCYASPGYSSEQFHIYFATVKNKNNVSKGGGLKEENESIKVVEIDAPLFNKMIRNGKIKDAKTYLAGLFMLVKTV